jgi:mersacidin/lichenicidin family type 2 lantibiotic
MNSNIVRAWKDEFYRQSLSDEERAQLPENPVGELELTDTELGSVFAAGGHNQPDEQNLSKPFNSVHHPYSYYDWDACWKTRRYDLCHHFNSYGKYWDDCHPRTYKNDLR